ncbi:MAG: formimidoylglutamate deiminase, partial [Methylobacteriaceae bacterium]|nr:formimidoylglutamate deiminase [Methylobacteriaceae bacterium]
MPSEPVIAHRLFAPLALTDDGFCSDVTISIDAGGDIVAVESGRAQGCEAVRGPVVPGMINVHSHAFQRAMVGLTQRAGPGADDFWTWREVMYRFVAAVEPEDVEAIAAGLCLDMLKSGFTTVGEFHYLHNAPDGGAYADTAEMSERIVAAAGSAGMALTLLPALYQHGGFGGGPLHEGQRRFALDTGAYLRLVETLAARHGSDPNVSIGVAPHSLRAVGPEALREAIAGVAALSPDAPVHIHAAEQTREVEDCLAWSGARPVAWLADHVGFDRRWCVIHSTHTDPAEKQALATAGAVVGLCPTTEADLGDGIFDLAGFEAAGGRFGIGTDSNVSASPAAELRQLEWSQRLAT